MSSIPVPPQPAKTNLYALLSLIDGCLTLLSNCISLLAVVVPIMPYVCAAASGLLSLGALVTGMAGLIQVKRAGNAQKGKGFAIAGIVLGILGLIASCLIPLLGTAIWGALGLQIGNLLLVPVE